MDIRIAIERGDCGAVIEYIENNDVNGVINDRGSTPLYIASQKGTAELSLRDTVLMRSNPNPPSLITRLVLFTSDVPPTASIAQ